MRIPRVGVSGGQLQTESQAKIRLEGLDTSGRGLQAIGGAVENVGNDLYTKMNEARNYTETAQAELYTTKKMSELLVKADTDTYTDPSGKVRLRTGKEGDFLSYDDEISKGREEVGKFFSNKDQQAKFMAEYDKSALVTRNALQNKFTKNMISEGQAAIDEKVNELVTSYSITGDAQFINGSSNSIESTYNNAVRLGYFDANTAYTKKEEAIKKAQNRAFIADAQRNRDEAKKKLEAGVYGFDSKEMDTALSTLVHYKELEDKNELLNKIDGRYELVNAIATGKEDVYNLSDAARSLIDTDDVLAEAISKATQSKKGYYAEPENEGIVKVFQEASEANDRDALSKLAVSAIYRNKNISPDKLGALLFYAQKKAVNLKLSPKLISPIGDETTDGEMAQKQIDAGINAISRWAKDNAVDVDQHGQVISEYMKSIQKGDAPYLAINNIIKSANIRLLPDMVNYPKEGIIIKDAKGNLKMAFPTGELKPLASSTKKIQPKKEDTSKSNELGFEELEGK
jgi:hypothetical protein